jgi:plastocyanin
MVILALSAFVFVRSSSNNEETNKKATNQEDVLEAESNSDNTPSASNPTNTVDEVTVTYTDSGFSPKQVSLSVGGKLNWVNNSSHSVEVGVNPHPIHTDDKAITNGEFTLNLDAGESKTVTVSKTGDFGYHNHLNSMQTGSVVVK